MKKLNVLLADDHPIVTEGLEVVLSAHAEINVLDALLNGEEVLRYVDTHEVDMVVLDINMPVMDGITCARQLKLDHPQVKVIILTMYAQKSFVEEIVKIGIDGCLLKSNTGKELYEAIKRVMSGKPYYDRLTSFDSPAEEIKQFKLSKREIEVIKHISGGLTSLMIAEKLFISEFTVQTHRRNIMRKLRIKNGAQLIQFAHDNGLI